MDSLSIRSLSRQLLPGGRTAYDELLVRGTEFVELEMNVYLGRADQRHRVAKRLIKSITDRSSIPQDRFEALLREISERGPDTAEAHDVVLGLLADVVGRSLDYTWGVFIEGFLPDGAIADFVHRGELYIRRKWPAIGRDDDQRSEVIAKALMSPMNEDNWRRYVDRVQTYPFRSATRREKAWNGFRLRLQWACLDANKRPRQPLKLVDFATISALAVDSETPEQEASDLLAEAIATVECKRDRRILQAWIEGLTIDATARELGVSPSLVNQRRRQVKQMLRKFFNDSD